MEYARQTVGTVGTAVRHRASSLTIPSFHCWVVRGEEPTGLSRSFTASAQSLSARTIDIAGSASSSPRGMQQVRFSANGENRAAAVHERFVVQNRDPLRDEEYPSLSSRQSSPAAKSLSTDSGLLYFSSNEIWAMNNERDATMKLVCAKEDDEEEEFPFRDNKAQHTEAANTTSSPHSIAPIPETTIPTHQFDAELHLAWLLNQSTPPRDFALTDLQPGIQEETAPTSPPQQQRRRPRRHIPGEAERRKGRVFDSSTDYTQLPSPSHTSISPHLTGQQLEKRAIPGLIPARRGLPRAPPAAPTERIPVRVVRSVSKKTGRKRREYQPTIRMKMFHPIIGGHEHEPSPLQTLPRNAISTSTATTTTSFPYHPPAVQALPHRPHPSQQSQHQTTKDTSHRYINPATGFILTDAEFPRDLSRDGPGSRFPAHLVDDFSHSLVSNRCHEVRERVPEVVLTSPTESGRTSRPPSVLTVGSARARPHSIEGYLPFTLERVTGDGGSVDESGSGVRGDRESGAETPLARRYLPYRPPPSPPTSPPPSPSAPKPDTADEDEEEDIVRRAVAMNIIHFAPQSPPPPPPSRPALPLPLSPSRPPSPSSTTTIFSINPSSTSPSSSTPATSTTTKTTTTRTPSPRTSLISNASSIRRIIDAGVIDFSPKSRSYADGGALMGSDGAVMGDDERVDGVGWGRGGGWDGKGEEKGEEKRVERDAKEVWKRLTLNRAGWEDFGGGDWGMFEGV